MSFTVVMDGVYAADIPLDGGLTLGWKEEQPFGMMGMDITIVVMQVDKGLL